MKNNKGISLITLVITIVIMVILISVVMSSGIESVKEANLTKIDNEIKSLKEAVNDRLVNYERNENLYPLIGVKVGESVFDYIRTIENLSSNEINEIISEISSNYNDETMEYYRLVGKEDAIKLGVENIDVEHSYIVDYYNCKVYGPVN